MIQFIHGYTPMTNRGVPGSSRPFNTAVITCIFPVLARQLIDATFFTCPKFKQNKQVSDTYLLADEWVNSGTTKTIQTMC
jgi:hypothetical protein